MGNWVFLKKYLNTVPQTAEALTMKIHTEGSAVAGTYKYEIAEQKSLEAGTASRNHGFPLELKVEASE